MSDTHVHLRSLFWEATLRCNAGCPFCGSRCGEEAGPEIDGETVYNTFASISKSYEPAQIMVNVTGGEPLLRKDLFEVMGRVRLLGFPWGMVTNGSLITEEKIRLMKETGMRTISVSIDDLFEAHEKLRRLPEGAFQQIVKMLQELDREQFLDTIQITTVVTRNNIGSLERMLDYFRQLPVDSWRLAIVDPIGRCREQEELLLRSGELDQFFSFLKRHRFNAKPVLTTSCSHYLGSMDNLYRPLSFHCEAGKGVASILADGSIFVCPNVPRRKELIQGNIKHDDFVKIWEERFKWFRNPDNRRAGECKKCPEWSLCRGDSLHTWDFDNNKPNFCYRHYDTFLIDSTGQQPATDKARNPDSTGQQRATDKARSMDSTGQQPATDKARSLDRSEQPPVSDRSGDLSSIALQPDADLIHSLKSRYPEVKGIRISYGSSSAKTVVFDPDAARQLYHFFHWGKKHPANICEQMMAAAGYFRKDRAWIEELIPVPLINRSEKTASFHMELHEYVNSEITLMNRNLVLCDEFSQEPLRLLGYIHSHPGELDAAMSMPDLEFHSALDPEGKDSYFTGIINPHSKDLCIYWDSIYYPDHVILFVDENDVEHWK